MSKENTIVVKWRNNGTFQVLPGGSAKQLEDKTDRDRLHTARRVPRTKTLRDRQR